MEHREPFMEDLENVPHVNKEWEPEGWEVEHLAHVDHGWAMNRAEHFLKDLRDHGETTPVGFIMDRFPTWGNAVHRSNHDVTPTDAVHPWCVRAMLGRCCLSGHKHLCHASALAPEDEACVVWSAMMMENPDLGEVLFSTAWRNDFLLQNILALARGTPRPPEVRPTYFPQTP
jgi:hypothetical protein